MKRVSKQKLIRAAMGGMQNAERKFSKFSHGNLLFARAPEYLLTTHVAETLHQAAPNHMTWLEFQLSHARLSKRANDDTPPPDKRKRGGRCDILLCWADSKEPRAVFEIKRDVIGLSEIKKDARRIIEMMNGGVEGNTLQFGAVLFSTMADCVHGRKVIRDRVEMLRDQLYDWRRAEGYEHMILNIIRGEIKKRPAGDFWAPLALICERRTETKRSRRTYTDKWEEWDKQRAEQKRAAAGS